MYNRTRFIWAARMCLAMITAEFVSSRLLCRVLVDHEASVDWEVDAIYETHPGCAQKNHNITDLIQGCSSSLSCFGCLQECGVELASIHCWLQQLRKKEPGRDCVDSHVMGSTFESGLGFD